MKANELSSKDLMIGDWVEFHQSDGQGFYAQVEALNDDGTFSESGFYADKDVSPIPLTEEILNRNCKNILRWKGKGYEWTWYNEDDGYIELSSRAEGETCKDGFFVSANGGEYRLFTIHYVHELQHALRLCGFEKDIEL